MINVIITDKNNDLIILMQNLLKSVPDIKILSQSTSGNQLISMTAKLKPDVVLLGIELTDMNSADVTKHIMAFSPVPILIIGYNKGCKNHPIAFNAICNGAIDVLEILKEKKGKISLPVKHKVLEAIRISAKIKVIKRVGNIKKSTLTSKKEKTLEKNNSSKIPFMIGIGSSTGGPVVLFNIINRLPEKIDFAVLIVQHIVPSFTKGLVDWLKDETKKNVVLAEDGETIKQNTFYIAPGNKHMTVSKKGCITLDNNDLYKGHRPSASVLFTSLANNMNRQSIGVILTGMGRDGLDGLHEMHKKKLPIIAQNEESSAVFGMPKACIDANLATSVSDDDLIAKEIMYYYSKFDRRQ